ncbi:HlyD family secretion protein [Pseudomonas sp. PP3]|uniref:HlyD family secretion protein n=1 Tax=Pseudomonas sp. PP3 TaxID=2815936 RepID=UPI001BAF737D|nr:HlyD family secretion protein [Pseudomonas sp. PP3]
MTTETTTTAIAAMNGDRSQASPQVIEERLPHAKALSAGLFAIVALIGISIVLYAWELPPFSSAIESTENAEIQGYVTSISPELSGYVFEVPVQDFQYVKEGDLLVRLDDRIYAQQLNRANAELDSQRASLENNLQDQAIAKATIQQNYASVRNAKVQVDKANADLKRSQALIVDGSISKQNFDDSQAAQSQAQSTYEQTKAALSIAEERLKAAVIQRNGVLAAVETATANVKLAEVNLSNTRITAPRDGELGQIGVRLGAWVNSGSQLMSLVPSDRWVIANMKETQMVNVRIGQLATFTVDAFNHRELTARVEQISPATGSQFALLQSDNATGNFVKIAKRISVRLKIDDNQPAIKYVRPGMSVVVRINTRSVIDAGSSSRTNRDRDVTASAAHIPIVNSQQP